MPVPVRSSVAASASSPASAFALPNAMCCHAQRTVGLLMDKLRYGAVDQSPGQASYGPDR